MKKNLFLTFLLLFSVLALPLKAQNGYRINFKSTSMADGKYYVGLHYQDTFIILDSANAQNGTVTFTGKKKLEQNVYVLLDDKKKQLFDFIVDDSQQFGITFDEQKSNAGMVVKGSKANTLMYNYMAKIDWANKESKTINEKMKDPSKKEEGKKDMEALSAEMKLYQEKYMEDNKQYKFTKLIEMLSNIKVPEAIPADSRDTNLREWQAKYYRSHYWDNINLKDHSLIYSPQFFDKTKLYFFNLLYSQEADTITKYAEALLDKVVNDSTMMRYFMEYALPKYERSTKNIGWDQVFVNLVKDYYLKGKCPWASDGEIFNKRQTVEYLSQSLIGAMGQELIMSDTNQSENPKDWISSHALPQKYVMLWFWDPDCNHCKKQTAELIILYDSLTKAGNKIFEVYAVGYESDVDKWKRYVREHKLPFINVGGPNVNIDYQEAYNVHGAPTMILLNADRQIIMNKTLATKNVLPFIKEYEKKHPEQANRAPSHWQLEGIRRAKIK